MDTGKLIQHLHEETEHLTIDLVPFTVHLDLVFQLNSRLLVEVRGMIRIDVERMQTIGVAIENVEELQVAIVPVKLLGLEDMLSRYHFSFLIEVKG
ncbi:MAG: hypothetical protein SOV61_12865, partial [Lachnospiraceae bacterium]|nr:hypothetical protein [Lachnospiraceae bacterium]